MTSAPGRAFFTRATISRRGSKTHRSNCVGGSTPAQLSKICTTSTPASIWRDEIGDRGLDEPRDERLENLRPAKGEEPRRRLIRRSVTGDHIARDGPRRAAKADEGGLLRQSALHTLDRLEDRRELL